MRHILHIMVLLPILVHGQQNLVPNPSFEEYSTCPGGNNGANLAWIHYAVPWISSSAAVCSPDYYNACSPPLFFPPDTYAPNSGVPENTSGLQFARTGAAYAGFYAYSGSWDANGREFIQVMLNDSIYAGVRYEVSFHVSLADSWWFAVGSLGAYFSPHQLVRTHYNEIPDVTPQIQSPEGVIYDSKEDWVEVRDTFNSRYGGEKYLIIGNFKPDSESSITFVDSGATLGHQASYYFIDDLSVIALDSIPDNIAEQEQLSFNAWPNPASDILHIQSRLPFARLRLLDISGRAVLSENMVTDRHTLQLSGIPPGLYLLEATDTEGRSAVRKVVVQ